MSRYIDAVKLISHLKDEIENAVQPFGGRSYGKGIVYGTELGLKMAISYAETLPTADVVEVRHGAWNSECNASTSGGFNRYTHVCSNCNYFYKTVAPSGYKFCPNCGARMEDS